MLILDKITVYKTKNKSPEGGGGGVWKRKKRTRERGGGV